MPNRFMIAVLTIVMFVALLTAIPVRASAPTERPEEVGLSSERLKRIGELMQRHIEARTFSGAVTLVARNGRIRISETNGMP